ncbi:MAG TPA: SDR family oxidoreductase [Euzebyales bacterium]|nr:SDR family oxidoreductase [Euzebyales bacterium]
MRDHGLAGARAVVTGAARGIGRAVAVGLAGRGADVACLDIDAEGAGETAAAVEEAGSRAVALTCDVTDWDAVQEAAGRASDALGDVDVLVTNAGGSVGDACHFLDLEPERWHRMVDRNLTATFYSALAFARLMARPGGRRAIVCISSQLSEVVRPELAHYCSAKGGVRQLVRAMAVDLASHGIRVNAVAPGPTWTPGTRALFERPEVRERNERTIPLGRLAQPEEMVGAVAYLASPDAAYVTGATLFVDGGYTLT